MRHNFYRGFLIGFVLAWLAHSVSAFDTIPLTGAGGTIAAHRSASPFGPGDIGLGSPILWGGLRAYSTATKGSKVANVCTVIATVDTCLDFSSDATTGNLVIVTIGGLAFGTITCTIKTLYDQSGANSCSGPCDMTEATVSRRPVLTVNCFGSLPCMTSAGTQFVCCKLEGPALTASQPTTLSVVGLQNSTARSGWVNGLNHKNGVADTMQLCGGLCADFTATDNAVHAIQGTFAGDGSGIAYVDGTVTSGLGTGSASLWGGGANVVMDEQAGVPDFPLPGELFELGYWGVEATAGQAASLNSNQHSYWGF